MSQRFTVAVLVSVFLLQACGSQHVVVRPVARHSADSTVTLKGPLRVQLVSGEMVRFPGGATMTAGRLLGSGLLHDLRLKAVAPVTALPLDSVAAIVNYRQGSQAAGFVVAFGLVAVLAYGFMNHQVSHAF